MQDAYCYETITEGINLFILPPPPPPQTAAPSLIHLDKFLLEYCAASEKAQKGVVAWLNGPPPRGFSSPSCIFKGLCHEK
jgi:hypothetical protein